MVHWSFLFHVEFHTFVLVLHMSLCMRKPTIWVPTRSDRNRAVQSQKQARRALELLDSRRRVIVLSVTVVKTVVLISCAVTAQLICAFVFLHMQIVGFLMRRLICKTAQKGFKLNF